MTESIDELVELFKRLRGPSSEQPLSADQAIGEASAGAATARSTPVDSGSPQTLRRRVRNPPTVNLKKKKLKNLRRTEEQNNTGDLASVFLNLSLNSQGDKNPISKIHKRRRRKRGGRDSRVKRRIQFDSPSHSDEPNYEEFRNQPMPGLAGHHHQGMMMNGPRGNGPPMNGPPMGNPMGPHMMNSPNGPMHGPIPGPIPSPINNIGPSPMSGPMQGNGPINGPMMSPMGPMNNGGPLGPMNSPLNGPMNGPGPMNGMSSPMNGPMSNPINGMGGGMNSPMGGPSQCPMNHVSSNAGGMNNNFMMPMSNIYQKPLPVSAGKVYPADQPMVFNSQNPNAPPIYPCGVCHKEVHDNDQAILCESGCNFWFHRGCTGLTEAAFQLLTAEVYAEWVCDKCLASKNIPLVKFKP